MNDEFIKFLKFVMTADKKAKKSGFSDTWTEVYTKELQCPEFDTWARTGGNTENTKIISQYREIPSSS